MFCQLLYWSDGGGSTADALICETGTYQINGQAATFGLTGNVTSSLEVGTYVMAGQAMTFTGATVPPVVVRGGGGRFLGATDYEYRPEMKVLLEEDTPDGIKYDEIVWKPDVSLSEIDEAIRAVVEQMGNMELTLKQSEVLRKKLGRLKKKRNMRIIFLTIQ